MSRKKEIMSGKQKVKRVKAGVYNMFLVTGELPEKDRKYKKGGI